MPGRDTTPAERKQGQGHRAKAPISLSLNEQHSEQRGM